MPTRKSIGRAIKRDIEQLLADAKSMGFWAEDLETGYGPSEVTFRTRLKQVTEDVATITDLAVDLRKARE